MSVTSSHGGDHAPGGHQILITREFDAPRHLV